jgi:outer membrane protein assembly factor BamD (BamD/ComL family)
MKKFHVILEDLILAPMKRILLLFSLCLFVTINAAPSRATSLWSYERFNPEQSVQEYFDRATLAFQDNEYDEALTQYLIVVHQFLDSPFYNESLYQAGVCYYQLGHFDLADIQFSKYLDQTGSLKYFEEVVDYKFQIAKHYQNGYKIHPFGIATLPRIAPAKEEAVELFDEVAAALPNSELAANALFSKAFLLKELKEYKESLEEFQILARRFPNHPLAAEGYIQMGEVYKDQSLKERQNADYVSLARLNKQNFEKAFPRDERIVALDKFLIEMLEAQAANLYETARFYERKGEYGASRIYYTDTTSRYPGTEAAKLSKERLQAIEKR